MFKNHFSQVRQLIIMYRDMGATEFQLFLFGLYLPFRPFFVKSELSYEIQPSKELTELLALFKG